VLTLFQQVQQNDLAIGKFQRVVMGSRIVLVDLPEDRGLVADNGISPVPRKPEEAEVAEASDSKGEPNEHA
jgi:hypothetical protein